MTLQIDPKKHTSNHPCLSYSANSYVVFFGGITFLVGQNKV